MSLLSRFFGNKHFEDSAQSQQLKKKTPYKLQDIIINYCGLEGDNSLKEMVARGDYEAQKFKSLELYNHAYDRYIETRLDDDLNLMYIYYKNNMACYIMWYYHTQIITLFGDVPENFKVSLYPTMPFELPESLSYHGKPTRDGVDVPFIDFYQDLVTNMDSSVRFVYDCISIRPA